MSRAACTRGHGRVARSARSVLHTGGVRSCHKHHVGTVCFKAFGAGKLLGDTSGYNQPLQDRPRGKLSSGGEAADTPLLPRLSVQQCLHYTLTCDPDVTLLGLSFPNEQDAAFAAAQTFTQPLAQAQMAAIRQLAVEAIANKGPCWWNPVEKH